MESAPLAPRVRVILRTRDRPTLLARALDDLLGQSYPNWELIILNHRGDRKTIESVIADRAGGSRPDWHVVDTDHPIGRDAILAMGMVGSSTDFTAIHDDDDTWSPEFLTQTVAWLDAHPEQVAVAVSTLIVEERIDEDAIVELDRKPIRPPFARVSLFDLVHAAHVPPIGYLFRSAAIQAAGGFDESLSVLGDWDLMLRLAAHGPIGYLDGEPLAYWRQRPQSDGHLANSVIGDLDLHRQTDRELRDRALRDYIDRNGIGGLLYMARYIDEQLADLRHESWMRAREIEEHIDARLDRQTLQLDALLARYTHHNAVIPSLRRAVHRIFHPRRRSGGQTPVG